MSSTQVNIPRKLNFDKSPAVLAEDEASYLLNHEREVSGVESSLSKSNPLIGNYPFGQVSQPAGENYSVGRMTDEITNEEYSWIHNSNGVNYIQRISDKHGIEIVYDEECLGLSLDPQHEITPFRSILRLDEIYNKDADNCKNRHGKQLIWTDGLNPIGCLDVEASIATNSFTTPFFDICPDPCAMIQLCVPEICGSVTAEFIPRSLSDIGLSNRLLEKGFKFMVRHIYYDGRAGEWSNPSTLYFISDDGCFERPDGQPRCMRLTIPMGNPMVEKTELAFSNGTIADDGINEIWKLYDTIEKYKKYNSSQQKWYERDLAESVSDSFNPETCTFEYVFCNDKDCNPIDTRETSRVFNPLPRQPQSILRIKENNFGFVNYIQGNCPIDKTEVDKFNIKLDCVPDGCKTEYVDVKVRLVVIDLRDGYTQFVFRMKGSYGDEDDITDKAYFGSYSLSNAAEHPAPVILLCNQEFNNARNFTAYIEGTDYFVEMKQWRCFNGFTRNLETGIISGIEDLNARNVKIGGGGLWYQEAIFRVPKGTSGIIRVKSHLSAINDPSTSTNIEGIIPLRQLNYLQGDADPVTTWDTIINRNIKEIPFDTCGITSGELSLLDAFTVLSVSGYNDYGSESVDEYLYSGYISDNNGLPVHGAIYRTSGNIILSTDCNGYYFYFGASNLSLSIKVEKSCADFTTVESRSINGQLNSEVQNDITISDADYANGFYEEVNITILDCDGKPIPGIIVALSYGKSKATDLATGVASFKVRNIRTRNKKVIAYAMDKNGCFSVGCNDECNPCMPKTSVINIQSCLPRAPFIVVANVTAIGYINIRFSTNKYSLKKGGRYPFGIVIEGDCGRLSPVYELPYLNVPKIQATGTSDKCVLSYSATGFNAPNWANCLKIVRGVNMNGYELQWVVDKIEKTNDGKIKLTIQSLNDYNEQYFFQTNTVYQWLKGDRIEFIKDQNGNVIPASQYGILNYLTISPFHDTLISKRTEVDADYFNQLIIEDNGKIDFLKAGCVIEIQRPVECTTETAYFAITSIPIVNGKLLVENGTFETFDTYEKKRIINGSALQTFEHHSPSDFWGTRLTDVGKVYFTNIYETERRYGRSISINAVGQFNYFGDLVKTMPATQQGDIIAASISDGKIILAICENDNFIAMASDDLLRVGNDGVIRALPTDSIIGNPEAKISGSYGCRYSDIGLIYFGDGFATWYDGKKYAYVKHNYQIAKDVAKDKVQTYFRTIGVKMDLLNKNADNIDKIRFSTGYNYLTKSVIITNRSLRHSGINNDKKLYESQNSTIIFHPESEDFVTMATYTAEGYGHLTLNDGFGCAFISYFNGLPYIHPVVPAKFNEFFGVAADRVIKIALNKYQNKERVPISFEVHSDIMYFVHEVTTSDPNFRSEVPPVKVKQFGNKWNASFLRNINSVGGLFNGKEANDFWMEITFVRDNTQELNGKPIYGSIDNAKRIKFDSLGMILFRFQLSEQSGLPEQNV